MAKNTKKVTVKSERKPTLGILLMNGQRFEYVPNVTVDEGKDNERTVVDVKEDTRHFYITLSFKNDDMSLVIQKAQLLGWDWSTPRG